MLLGGFLELGGGSLVGGGWLRRVALCSSAVVEAGVGLLRAPSPVGILSSSRLPGCTSSWETTWGAANRGEASGMGAPAPHVLPPVLLPGVLLWEQLGWQPLSILPSQQIWGFPRVSSRFCAGGEAGAGACAGGLGTRQLPGPAWWGFPTRVGQDGAKLLRASRQVVGRSGQAGCRGSHWAIYRPVCPRWYPFVSRGTLGIGGASGCRSGSRAALSEPGMFWGLCTPKHAGARSPPYRGVQPRPITPRTSQLTEEHPLGCSCAVRVPAPFPGELSSRGCDTCEGRPCPVCRHGWG